MPASDAKAGVIRDATEKELQQLRMPVKLVLRLAGLARGARVSWLDFGELENEMDTIRLKLNNGDLTAVGSGNRIGSVYFVESRVIILNVRVLQNLISRSQKRSTGIGIMLLHEYLGALGYPDENYEISSVLYVKVHATEILSPENRQLIDDAPKRHLDHRPRILKNKSFQVARGCGVTSTGGGGDPYLAEVKSLLLRMVVDIEGLSIERREQLLDLVLAAPIESATLKSGFDSIMPTSFSGISRGVSQ